MTAVSLNFDNGAFGSAPALMSFSIIVALPLIAANCIGMTPSRFAADTFAPARISRSAISTSSARTAQCSAVVPSTCAALTSAFFCSKERTASLFLFITASAISLLARAKVSAESNSANTHPPPITRLIDIFVFSSIGPSTIDVSDLTTKIPPGFHQILIARTRRNVR